MLVNNETYHVTIDREVHTVTISSFPGGPIMCTVQTDLSSIEQRAVIQVLKAVMLGELDGQYDEDVGEGPNEQLDEQVRAYRRSLLRRV